MSYTNQNNTNTVTTTDANGVKTTTTTTVSGGEGQSRTYQNTSAPQIIRTTAEPKVIRTTAPTQTIRTTAPVIKRSGEYVKYDQGTTSTYTTGVRSSNVVTTGPTTRHTTVKDSHYVTNGPTTTSSYVTRGPTTTQVRNPVVTQAPVTTVVKSTTQQTTSVPVTTTQYQTVAPVTTVEETTTYGDNTVHTQHPKEPLVTQFNNNQDVQFVGNQPAYKVEADHHTDTFTKQDLRDQDNKKMYDDKHDAPLTYSTALQQNTTTTTITSNVDQSHLSKSTVQFDDDSRYETHANEMHGYGRGNTKARYGTETRVYNNRFHKETRDYITDGKSTSAEYRNDSDCMLI